MRTTTTQTLPSQKMAAFEFQRERRPRRSQGDALNPNNYFFKTKMHCMNKQFNRYNVVGVEKYIIGTLLLWGWGFKDTRLPQRCSLAYSAPAIYVWQHHSTTRPQLPSLHHSQATHNNCNWNLISMVPFPCINRLSYVPTLPIQYHKEEWYPRQTYGINTGRTVDKITLRPWLDYMAGIRSRATILTSTGTDSISKIGFSYSNWCVYA